MLQSFYGHFCPSKLQIHEEANLPRGRLRRGLKRGRATHVAIRLWIKTQRPGSLRNRQALVIMAVVDLAERLVIDHDRLRRPAPALPPAPRM